MISSHFENIRNKILTELEKANDEIIIAVYWFTNHQLFNMLMHKLSNNVWVELIIHNDFINNRDTGLNFQSFIDKGGKFYFSDSKNPMHNKFCIIDRKVLINGSYNWTYFAEEKNRENILVIQNEPKIISEFRDEFYRLKNNTFAIEEIGRITIFDSHEFNIFSAHDYLLNDLLYQAQETGNNKLVEQAINFSKNKIETKGLASKLGLVGQRTINHSLGIELENNSIEQIVEAGSILPFSFTKTLFNSVDNQKEIKSKLVYGESEHADKNQSLIDFNFDKFPLKPRKKSRIRFNIHIDYAGTLKLEIYSLDTGEKMNIEKDINFLILG